MCGVGVVKWYGFHCSQELELTARAHGIPTPSLNPETQQLAVAAEHKLGVRGEG